MPQLHWAGAGGADKQHWAPLASHLWQKKSPGHRGQGRVGEGGQGAGRYLAGTAFRPVPEEKETEVVFRSQTESEYINWMAALYARLCMYNTTGFF